MKICKVAMRNTLQRKSEKPHLLSSWCGYKAVQMTSLLAVISALAGCTTESLLSCQYLGLRFLFYSHVFLQSHPKLRVQSLHCDWFVTLGKVGFPDFF